MAVRGASKACCPASSQDHLVRPATPQGHPAWVPYPPNQQGSARRLQYREADLGRCFAHLHPPPPPPRPPPPHPNHHPPPTHPSLACTHG